MQLSSAFSPSVFVVSTPQHLPKPSARFGEVGSILQASSQPQMADIGAAASSAFLPSGTNGGVHHKQLSERLASVISHQSDEDDQEDPEIVSALGRLSLSTTPASGRRHQHSAPLPEQMLDQIEQRVILKGRSRRWRHGQSTPGRRRLSSCPGSISPGSPVRQDKVGESSFPVEIAAPSAKKLCCIDVSHSSYPTPCNSPASEDDESHPAFSFLSRASASFLTEAGIQAEASSTVGLQEEF